MDEFTTSLAVGLPMVKVFFNTMISNCCADEQQKTELREKCHLACTLNNTGCVKLTFDKYTAFIYLDECLATHDFGIELEKVYSKVLPKHHITIRNYISMLIHFGRQAYAQMINTPLLEDIKKYLPIDFDEKKIHLDPLNTTLYLMCKKIKWEPRVGIFVRVNQLVDEEIVSSSGDGLVTSSSSDGDSSSDNSSK
jgi:hypothetical protein